MIIKISKIRELLLLYFILPIADKVMGLCIIKWYRQISRMNKWNREAVESWQNIQLQKFIIHAYNNTIYYKKIFDELSLTPNDIKCAEDLKKLPIINKEIVAKHYDEIVPKNISNYKYRKGKTGGTTGEPMNFLYDENTWGYVTANKMVNWRRTSYRYGDKFVVLGSASLFSKKPSLIRRIYDKLRNEFPLNGVNLSDDICGQYVDFIKNRNIKYIYGYAASLYILAKYVKENSIVLTQIEVVFTTSEKLTEQYREIIKAAFSCKIMDCYGAGDAGISAYEYHKGEYPIGYNAIAEIINPTEINSGTLITTNFLNYSFPLIRYEFGDEARLSNNYKNYNGQVLLEITGRTSDVIRLDNGRNITGPGFTVLMKSFDIEAYQIKKIDGLCVELQILPNRHFTKKQESLLKKTIIKFIGNDCELKLTYVTRFEPLKNGKRSYFIN